MIADDARNVATISVGVALLSSVTPVRGSIFAKYLFGAATVVPLPWAA